MNVPADIQRTRENGQKIANALMDEWQRKNPDESWVTAQRSPEPAAKTADPAAAKKESTPPQPNVPGEVSGALTGDAAALDIVAIERAKHTIKDPHDNKDLVGRGQGATYGQITKTDVAMWERQTLKFVAEGSRVFHDADELGSPIAVSCDMCHPDASNTHAETYPKFQVQLGRVALLRDMINWCIEHPVRGKRLAEDDSRMRALEAYIYAQRSGTPIAYGKR
jgi:cytochrome c553